MKKLLLFSLFIMIQGCGLGEEWPLSSSRADSLSLSDLKLYVSIKEYKRSGTALVGVGLRTRGLLGVPIKFDQSESFKATIVNHQGETETTTLTYDSSAGFFWRDGTFVSDFYGATVSLPEVGSNYTITYTDTDDGIETNVSFSSQGGPDITSPEDGSSYSVFDDLPIEITWTPGGFDQLNLSYLFASFAEDQIELEDTGSYSIERNTPPGERGKLGNVRIRLYNYTAYDEAPGFGSADIIIETRDEINLGVSLNRS